MGKCFTLKPKQATGIRGDIFRQNLQRDSTTQNLVAMKSVPKRGSVGFRYELSSIISKRPDAIAFRY